MDADAYLCQHTQGCGGKGESVSSMIRRDPRTRGPQNHEVTKMYQCDQSNEPK